MTCCFPGDHDGPCSANHIIHCWHRRHSRHHGTAWTHHEPEFRCVDEASKPDENMLPCLWVWWGENLYSVTRLNAIAHWVTDSKAIVRSLIYSICVICMCLLTCWVQLLSHWFKQLGLLRTMWLFHLFICCLIW